MFPALEAISADAIEADVAVLSGEVPLADGPIVSRDLHHPDLARAQAWLVDRAGAIDGLVVRTEPFDVDVAGALPGVANVIAELPGDPDQPWIVVGAHYDSIASFDDAWEDPTTQPAPGADDDASGAAALLALASALAADANGFRHPIRFVWFSAEEYGLLGSVAHVAGLDAPVAAMIQLDPVGYDPGDAAYLWVVRDETSGPLGDRFAAAATDAGAGVDVVVIDAEDIGGDARSDHHPFWEAGIPALHLASFPQPPTYHTMGDTLDNVDPTFTHEVAVAVGQLVVDLAEPRTAEAPAGCGCDAAGAPWGPLLPLGGLVARRRRRPA